MTKSIHSATAEAGKLAALRARTDQDLGRLVQLALEAGLRRARESAYDDAEAIYHRVAELLPLLDHLTGPEPAAARQLAVALRSELDQAAYAGSGVLS